MSATNQKQFLKTEAFFKCFSSLSNFNGIVILSSAALIVIVYATVMSVNYQNSQVSERINYKLSPYTTATKELKRTLPIPSEFIPDQFVKTNKSVTPIPTISTSNWLTYKNSVNGYSFKYPPDFFISEEDDTTTVYSNTYECETEGNPPYDGNIKINASEIKIEIKKMTGKNYHDIWQKAYGFEFYPQEDERTTIDGYNAYYFDQGAEMTFGRRAILIDIAPAKAIQINSWTPILVYKCDENLRKYPGFAEEILSTLKFESSFLINPATGWIINRQYANFEYPPDWKITKLSDSEIIISSKVNSTNTSLTPDQSEALLHIGIIHSATENYDKGKNEDPNGLVTWGRCINTWGTGAVTTYYWKDDPNIVNYDKIFTEIIKFLCH